MMRCALVIAFVLLSTASSGAQLVFECDFESGDLCSWSGFNGPCVPLASLQQQIESGPDVGMCLQPLEIDIPTMHLHMTACADSTCDGGQAGCQFWLSIEDVDLAGESAVYVVPASTVDLYWLQLSIYEYSCSPQLSAAVDVVFEFATPSICGWQQRTADISAVGAVTTSSWSPCSGVPVSLVNALEPEVEAAVSDLVQSTVEAELTSAVAGVTICAP